MKKEEKKKKKSGPGPAGSESHVARTAGWLSGKVDHGKLGAEKLAKTSVCKLCPSEPTYPTVGAIRQFLAAHIPAKAVLVLFLRVRGTLRAQPARMRRSLPARSWQRVIANLPYQYLPRRGTRNKRSVGGKGKSHNRRVHGQETFRFGLWSPGVPDQNRAVVTTSRNEALIVKGGLTGR